MAVLVVAEHDGISTRALTGSVVRCALAVDKNVDVLALGENTKIVAVECAYLEGVRKVLEVGLVRDTPEALGEVVNLIAREGHYTHVFFSSATSGKAAMPRAAALLDVPALSEVCAVVNANTFKRYIYAGSLLATVRIDATPVVATVRTTAFEPVGHSAQSAASETLDLNPGVRSFIYQEVETEKSERPDLATAKTVVAAGRGVIDEAGFKAAGELADKMGAALGSTRALVDAFIAPSDTQVGQTGKIVAPDLYMAFGISGAIQHLAGMKDSKVIVAVNNDPEAPIFEVSDYYLVADAVETIQELHSKLPEQQ